MKYFASLLLAGALALGARTAAAQNGNPDLSKGDAPVGLFGHTPVPTPAKPAAAGPRKPLEVSVARDEKGGGAGTTFAKGDAKLYLLVKDTSGVKGDQIRAVWIAQDTGGALPKDKKINDFTQTLTGAGQPSTFYTEIKGGFPPGKYQTDVYENSKLVKSVKFTVKK